MAEQEIGAVETIAGDARIEGLARRRSKRPPCRPVAVHVGDRQCLAPPPSPRCDRRRQAIRPRAGARNRCATGIQNRVWYSASVVIRMVLADVVMIVSDVFDRDAGERQSGHRATRARCGKRRRVRAGRERRYAEAGSRRSAGSIRLSRRAGLNRLRSLSVTADPSARLAAPLAIWPRLGRGARALHASPAAKRKAGVDPSRAVRTSATRSAAWPSLRWKNASISAA